LGTRGIAEPPQTNLRERQGYARISLEIAFNLNFEPIQRTWIGWLKIYEVLGSCTNVPDKAIIM